MVEILFLTMAENECYVCMEPCGQERSPCECAIPVHAECLTKFLDAGSSKHCSVCKSPLEIESFELDLENPLDVVLVREQKAYPWNVAICVFTYYFLLYSMLGYFGKLIHYVASERPIEFDETFFNMFTLEHFIAAMLVTAMLACVYHTSGDLITRE